MIQIRIAICVNLRLAYLKPQFFDSRIGQGMQQTLHLLQLNLFERRGLYDLIVGNLSDPPALQLQTSLRFSMKVMGQQ